MEDTLKQILMELQNMRQELQNVSHRLDNLEQGQKEIRLELNELKKGQEQLQKNIIDNMGLYNKKILEYVDDKTEALNKRVYAVETDIQRILR
jgi:chaperonin cofactor prefoldin